MKTFVQQMLAQRLDFAAKLSKKKQRKIQRSEAERAYTFCGHSKHKINVNSLFSIEKKNNLSRLHSHSSGQN